jgi:hypothetical protein
VRDERAPDAVPWRIAGTYLEACNCEAICPCRKIGGRAGGRSSYGICMGALSWAVTDGHAGDLELSGLGAVLACRYDDDEPGSPWSWILYLDERASEGQQEALEGIFTGRLGGDALEHFPWAWKASKRLAVRRVVIEVDHAPRRQWLRIRDHVTVRIRDRYAEEATVTCVIPGHDRGGEELVAEQLRVEDGPLAFELSGICGYASTFAYFG